MAAAAPAIETVTVTADRPAPSHFWAGHGFSFHDVLDALNPLQHLPVISTIYHAITGDRPGNVAEIVGDGLYGGLLGLAGGIANVALKEATGKDIGDTILSVFTHDKAGSAAPSKAPEPLPSPPPASDAPAPAASASLSPVASSAPANKDSAAAPPPADPAALKPLAMNRNAIPIDVSERGVMAMRAQSAAHNRAPVPLALPPGTQLAYAQTAVDASARMRDGLDKYDAMLARRTGGLAGASVDQIH
jgi:hypothetical protein